MRCLGCRLCCSDLLAAARPIVGALPPGLVRQLILVVLLVIFAAASSALAPVWLKDLIDSLTVREAVQRYAVWGFAVAYVGALALSRLANEIRGIVFGRAEQWLFRLVSERLFFHVMRLPMNFHVETKAGTVSQSLDNGLEGLRIILRLMVLNLLPVAVELITIVVVLKSVVTEPFVLLFVGGATCYVMVFVHSGETVAVNARQGAAARASAAAVMTDRLCNWETIKCFAAEAAAEDRVKCELERCETQWSAFYKCVARNGICAAAVFVSFLAGSIVYGVLQVRRGAMSIGDFVLISAYMLQLARPVEAIGFALQGVSRGVAMLEGAVRLSRAPIEPLREMKGITAWGPAVLEFVSVSASYGTGGMVLEGVSFAVRPGQTLGIVGKSGSGKSTIARLVTRLLEPEIGEILLDGHAISRMNLWKLRVSVAVVSQNTALLDESVMVNIGIGCTNAGIEEIECAARIAQIHDVVMSLPKGYDTVVGQGGAKLSGGERQRICIARAILKRPRIFVFDEATSALDVKTERAVLDGIRSMRGSITTLMIAHRLSSIMDADEIVVIESGRSVERGSHAVLLQKGGVYADMWSAQRGTEVAA